MKKLILSLPDSNMAGHEWRWEFYLERKRRDAYALGCQQIVTEGEPSKITPAGGLCDGADVYAALRTMVSDAGYDLSEDQRADDAEKLPFSVGVWLTHFARRMRGERLKANGKASSAPIATLSTSMSSDLATIQYEFPAGTDHTARAASG